MEILIKDRQYNEQHDAYYSSENDQWLEKTCSDKSCGFCTTRPERPSEVGSLPVIDSTTALVTVQWRTDKDSWKDIETYEVLLNHKKATWRNLENMKQLNKAGIAIGALALAAAILYLLTGG